MAAELLILDQLSRILHREYHAARGITLRRRGLPLPEFKLLRGNPLSLFAGRKGFGERL